MKKTGGRKSRATLPLTQIYSIYDMYVCVWFVYCTSLVKLNISLLAHSHQERWAYKPIQKYRYSDSLRLTSYTYIQKITKIEPEMQVLWSVVHTVHSVKCALYTVYGSKLHNMLKEKKIILTTDHENIDILLQALLVHWRTFFLTHRKIPQYFFFTGLILHTHFL